MEWLESLVGHVSDFNIALFLLLYVVAATLPIPSWPLTLAAGYMFGFPKGLAVALTAIVLGSISAFAISRFALRHPLERAIKRHKKLKAVEAAMRHGGWKAIALLQLSPAVPFGLQNYFLGATKVGFGPYLAGTVIACIPAAVAYVGAGSTGRMLDGLGPWTKWGLLALGVAATVVLSVWMGRVVKRRLRLS